MRSIEAKSFEHLGRLESLSERNMREHLRLYAGYVRKFNELLKKREALQHSPDNYAGADCESLKVDLTYALGAIKNHELYFEILGGMQRGKGAGPEGPLLKAIEADFRSFPPYGADLKPSALLGRGWAWTAYDRDQGGLFNYSGAQNGIPVWNTQPILAIDLYGHAYFYDFGANKASYVDAVVSALDWMKIGQRYEVAMESAGK